MASTADVRLAAVLPNVADMTITQRAGITSPPSDQRFGVRSLTRAHPLTAFFLCTLVLSWWPWPLYAAGHSPLPVASFGPFLAALLVLGLTEGRRGIRALLRSMLDWRVGVRWWLVFIAVPVVITAIAAGAEPAARRRAAVGRPA